MVISLRSSFPTSFPRILRDTRTSFFDLSPANNSSRKRKRCTSNDTTPLGEDYKHLLNFAKNLGDVSWSTVLGATHQDRRNGLYEAYFVFKLQGTTCALGLPKYPLTKSSY